MNNHDVIGDGEHGVPTEGGSCTVGRRAASFNGPTLKISVSRSVIAQAAVGD